MKETVILMGNLGYLRGIDGSLKSHMRYAHRHIYSSRQAQQECVQQVIDLISRERPDICCFVEIDKGNSERSFNQLEALASKEYAFYDIENKYGTLSPLRTLPLMRGKSNGFLSRCALSYEKVYFTDGTKRLIYKLVVAPHITLFFAHFSLKKKVREKQLLQMRLLLKETPGEVILLGDFNISGGFGELTPLLQDNNLVVLNSADVPTFRFHKYQMPLDICICSQNLARNAQLKVAPQPYSDHEALILTVKH